MRERQAPVRAALALALVLAAPAGGIAEPVAAQDRAARLSLEMAAHRRLVGVMDGAGHRASPFVTDGCSGGLSLAWGAIADLLPPFVETRQAHPPWGQCCVTHDRAYHAAGGARTAADSHRARVAADEALRTCVRETGALRTRELSETCDLTEAQVTALHALIAKVMFDAVRLAGNAELLKVYEWLRQNILRARHRINDDSARVRTSLAEHEGIMAAMAARARLDLADRLVAHNEATAAAIIAKIDV